MAIQINIEKTEEGYDFHNANLSLYPLVATIREGRNKPGIFIWSIFDGGMSGFSDIEGAMGRVKLHLTQIAVERLGEDIDFVKIEPTK